MEDAIITNKVGLEARLNDCKTFDQGAGVLIIGFLILTCI
jgi:hypothetical protein